MKQEERRIYLIKELLREQPERSGIAIPTDETGQRLLQRECARLMRSQGHEEGAGLAKITPAYNLLCKYVLHTVGPIIRGWVTQEDEDKQEVMCYGYKRV